MATAPIDIAANDEEAMILAMVRELVAEKVAPRAAEIDATGEFPWDVKELFAQNDLLGIPIPAEYGGLGGTFLTYVKVVEEIAKACASSALIVAVQELGMLPIIIGGSEEQKHRFLPKIASGEHIVCYALTEVSSGSDALGSMRTRAGETRRELRAQRAKDLDHQRQRGRRRLRLCRHRSGGGFARRHRVRRREGHARASPSGNSRKRWESAAHRPSS